MADATWTVGDVRITRVVEIETRLPPEGLLPDATPEALEKHHDWLRPHFLTDEGEFVLAIQGLVVESAGRTILVDTCLGEHALPFPMAEAPSRFLDELAAAGFPREEIDVVLCTHLHFDHVGWNTMQQDGRWVPSFPNARYLFARTEFEHWKGETDSGRGQEYASSFANAVVPVLEAGLADLVGSDHRLTDEVWLEATPGHTPGHVAVRIASKGAQALITGDLTHHPVQWAEAGWGMPADVDREQAAETRRRLLAEHTNAPVLVIGTHYAAPTAGHLVATPTGVAFRALL